MLEAATEAAEQVMAQATTTSVEPKFFDELWRALEMPPKPNPALAKRARSSRRVVQR